MNHEPQAGRLSGRVVLTVGTGLVVPALPTFLVGATAGQVRAELDLSAAALGALIATLFVVSAVAAPFTGRLADRRGARFGIALGTALSALAMVGIAVFVRHWAELAACMVCAGVGLAMVDPGLTRLIAGAVPEARRGLAFGIKEASIPLATMAAGFAVPTIAVTAGWRGAFAVAAVPLVAVVLLLTVGWPRPAAQPPDVARPAHPSSTPRRSPVGPATLALAAGAAFASMAATGISVFLTDSAVAAGLTQSYGGLLLGVASITGVAARIGTGVLADRRPDTAARIIPLMLTAGAVMMLLGAIGTAPLLGAGAVGALAGGWGWTGLFFLTLVRADPAQPGAIAGVGLSGLTVGNALGPVVFGAVAQTVSYPAAWLLAALATALAAGSMATGIRLLARRTSSPNPADPQLS